MFKVKILALGKAGSNISKSFEEHVDKTYYINTHKEEMEQLSGDFFVHDRDYTDPRFSENNPVKLCVDGKGTGRSPNLGDMIARNNRDVIEKFILNSFSKDDMIIVMVGGGGGSGTGFAPLVSAILSEHDFKFGVIYTLPLRQEGSPTIPNAINGLDNLVRALRGSKVAPFFIIDNQLIYEEEGASVGDNFWKKINDKIANILLFTRLLDEDAVTLDGINTLDEREFIRIFRLNKQGNDIGFSDIKSFQFNPEDAIDSFKLGLKETSMSTARGYDYLSAEGMLVVIERPESDAGKSNAKIADLMDFIARRYAGKKLLQSTVSSANDEYRVNILFAGLNAPVALNKISARAESLIEKGKSKREKKASIKSIKFVDEFTGL